MKIKTALHRPDTLIQALLEVWEASVRATHDFLSERDILALRPLVRGALAEIPSLTYMTGPDGLPLGFMGVDGDKIEMLFISPQNRGSGLGRRFIDHAVNALQARFVDVNEQNPQGAGFYRHMGFTVFRRSALDGQGNPFPILHLRLEAQIPTPGDRP